MIIQDIFAKDINRPISGVIKVGQEDTAALAQEVGEYVITKELRKHLIKFFNFYYDAYSRPTDDIGVWLSGHFGSGKSHLLKMLSYLLSNKEIVDEAGVKRHVVDYFQEKFDDNASFMPIEMSVKNPTETILFNIDVEGSINKDNTAVLRVFAKVFYNHLGYYGSDLKLVELEKYIDSQGKTDEFRRIFEEAKGTPWTKVRKNYKFFKKHVVAAMMEAVGISEEEAQEWVNDKSPEELSIAALVEDIKAYVDTKPEGFRLLFMVDEVGQYVGTSRELLLNLQSLVETVGTKCQGQVWVVCTGQEAVDELIKARMDLFSRIWDRFKTRLVLTSSSAEEVIRERILKKKKECVPVLQQMYDEKAPALRNLFTFTEATGDMVGFTSAKEYVSMYPFPKYQFIILHKVFESVRKSGNAGINLAVGARSMLSGFKEAAQKVQDKDEFSIVPFHLFYDTVHTFLNNTIRSVIERCQQAAENGHGLELQDVNVLKLLYLLRNVDDVKASLDNIVILMAEDIRVDKVVKRDEIQASLDRLLAQNYIGRVDDVYNFLTDEEQEIARDIRLINIDGAMIASKVGNMVYDDIYSNRKFSYGQYVFPIDRYVDSQQVGQSSNGMKIQVMTMASDATEKNEMTLLLDSKDKIIIVLPETSYYDSLEQSMKIRTYALKRNVSQLPESVQKIIRGQQESADKLEKDAKADLENALAKATYYVAGEKANIKGADAKAKMNQALELLVENVYTELNLINHHYASDDEIRSVLQGNIVTDLDGHEVNMSALAKVEEYLTIQSNKQMKTYMSDIQSHFQEKPMGWKEIDIAGLVATLIRQQKLVAKYAGEVVQPNNPKLITMLRKKSELGNTLIAKRQKVSAQNLRVAINFLREYYSVMDVPASEDDFVKYASEKFIDQQVQYNNLLARYVMGKKYPDKELVAKAVGLLQEINNQSKDNTAFVNIIIKSQEKLYDMQEDMENVENFFKNQVDLFDSAVSMVSHAQQDNAYIKQNEKANDLLNKIRMITVNGDNAKVYSMVPQLNTLLPEFRTVYGEMLDDKRGELNDVMAQCEDTIFALAADHKAAEIYKEKTVKHYNDEKLAINHCNSLIHLEGMKAQIASYMDSTLKKIKLAIIPPAPKPKPQPKPATGNQQPKPQKKCKTLYRVTLLEEEVLTSKADVDAYIENLRTKLMKQLQDVDEIKIS